VAQQDVDNAQAAYDQTRAAVLDSRAAVDAAKKQLSYILSAGGQAVIQEWLPGRREAVSLFHAHGRFWARFAQVSHPEWTTLGGASVLCESIPPLLDIPMHDATLARLAGGEYVVAAALYALALRDPRRYRTLLWLCALDQLFAVVMPALALAHGEIPYGWKTVAPIPLQAVLALLFAAGARRRDPA